MIAKPTGRPRRPMPEGFQEASATMGGKALCKLFKCSPQQVRTWRGGSIVLAPRPSAPADFLERAGLMSGTALALHYKVGRRLVTHWLKDAKIKAGHAIPGKPAFNRRPVPDDFLILARTMHKTALKTHYGTSDAVINRWVQETGVTLKQWVATKHNVLRLPHGHLAQTRTTSIYDDAADDLRRERFPVNRCNDKGGYDEKGRFWRVGWSILTPDELLQRAAKYRRAA